MMHDMDEGRCEGCAEEASSPSIRARLLRQWQLPEERGIIINSSPSRAFGARPVSR